MQILLLIVGAALGAVTAYLVCRTAATRTEERQIAAETALKSAQAELLRAQQANNERAEALGSLRAELAAAQAQLETERRHNHEKIELLTSASEEMAVRFKNLANEILEEKSKKFTLQNENNLKQVLDPLKTKLTEFQTTVERVYVNESKDRSALAQQVTHLAMQSQQISQQAQDLTNALKGSVKAQGNWGELLLEKILEDAGLRKGSEYELRETYTQGDGKRGQPDVVINLPDHKHIVVDAKVSLNAYSEYANAQTDAQRGDAIDRHLASLRAHIKGLSGKNYQELLEINSPDFVVMFIPIEPAFSAALMHDDQLWRDAYNKNVLLVGPVNLLFVLRTVSNLWNAEVQRQYVADIVKRGSELYDKFAGFVESMQEIGFRLDQAQSSYSEAMSRMKHGRGNLLRQAEQLKEFGIKPKKNLPEHLLEDETEEPAAGPQMVKRIAAAASEE